MTAPQFPSGRWGGFYVQSGARSPMSLSLTFESGAIGGGGVDGVGDFYIHGSYTSAGAVDFVKQYVGRHQVRYVGAADGRGIAGTWTIKRIFRGQFQIWPISGPGAEVTEEVVEAQPIGFAPVR